MPKLALFLVSSLIVVVPLIVLPWFSNILNTGKVGWLFLVALGLIGSYAISLFTKDHARFTLSKLLVPVIVFGLAMLASALLSTPYPREHLFGSAGVWLAWAVTVVVGGTMLQKDSAKWLAPLLAFAGTALSVLTFLQATGWGPSRLLVALTGMSAPHDLTFNVAGSPFLGAQLFVVVLAGLAAEALFTRTRQWWIWVGLGASTIGLLLTSSSLMPGSQTAPTLLPLGVGWSIAIDTLRSPRTALVGIGPESFNVAYQLLKPIWVNGQPWWQSQFQQSSNTPLTLLPTAGLLATLAWFALGFVTLRQATKLTKTQRVPAVVVVTTWLLQLLFPANLLTITLQAAALAFWVASTREHEAYLQLFSWSIGHQPPTHGPSRSRWLTRGLGVLGLLSVAFLSWSIGQVLLADHYFFRGFAAFQQQNAVSAYNYQQRAVKLNPFNQAYHREYASTNILIARALSNKADRTEQDQQQALALVQQSVREGRAAVAIASNNSANWLLLGRIYRELIPSTDDAAQFSLNSYVEAINRDPANPLNYLELAGVLYDQKQYAQAANVAQQAVNLKPDLPNAYYNLANALREAKNLEGSRAAYQKTLSFLKEDTTDYQKTAEELKAVEELIAKQPKASPTPQGQTPTTQGSTPSLLEQQLNPADLTGAETDQSLSGVTPTGSAATPASSSTPVASPAATN